MIWLVGMRQPQIWEKHIYIYISVIILLSPGTNKQFISRIWDFCYNGIIAASHEMNSEFLEVIKRGNVYFIGILMCVCVCVCVCVCCVCSMCLTLWNPKDCSPLGSSVHGMSQEWVSMLSSRGSSQPRDWTQVSQVCYIGSQVHYHERHLGSPAFWWMIYSPFIHYMWAI